MAGTDALQGIPTALPFKVLRPAKVVEAAFLLYGWPAGVNATTQLLRQL